MAPLGSFAIIPLLILSQHLPFQGGLIERISPHKNTHDGNSSPLLALMNLKSNTL